MVEPLLSVLVTARRCKVVKLGLYLCDVTAASFSFHLLQLQVILTECYDCRLTSIPQRQKLL